MACGRERKIEKLRNGLLPREAAGMSQATTVKLSGIFSDRLSLLSGNYMTGWMCKNRFFGETCQGMQGIPLSQPLPTLSLHNHQFVLPQFFRLGACFSLHLCYCCDAEAKASPQNCWPLHSKANNHATCANLRNGMTFERRRACFGCILFHRHLNLGFTCVDHQHMLLFLRICINRIFCQLS